MVISVPGEAQKLIERRSEASPGLEAERPDEATEALQAAFELLQIPNGRDGHSSAVLVVNESRRPLDAITAERRHPRLHRHDTATVSPNNPMRERFHTLEPLGNDGVGKQTRFEAVLRML